MILVPFYRGAGNSLTSAHIGNGHNPVLVGVFGERHVQFRGQTGEPASLPESVLGLRLALLWRARQLAASAKRWGLALVIGAVLALVVVASALPALRHAISRPTQPATAPPAGIPPVARGKYLAVLPIRVLGDQESLGYIADGIGEALSARLSQVKGQGNMILVDMMLLVLKR